jgi:hypothetical protein
MTKAGIKQRAAAQFLRRAHDSVLLLAGAGCEQVQIQLTAENRSARLLMSCWCDQRKSRSAIKDILRKWPEALGSIREDRHLPNPQKTVDPQWFALIIDGTD